MRSLLALFLVLIFVSPVFAARPLVTDDFKILDFGKDALEMGYNPTRLHNTRQNSFSVNARRGVAQSVELGLEVPYYLNAPSGLGDVIIHANLQLFKISTTEGLANRIDIKLPNPNPNSGVGTNASAFSLIMIYSKKLGDVLTHYNLGWTGPGVSPGQGDQYDAGIFDFGVAGEYSPWKDSKTLVFEWWGTQTPSTRVSCIQVGGKWEAQKDLVVDFGYTVGLTADSPNMLDFGFTKWF
ncbi:MAG: hypothetical protein NT099_03785 [Candidatus Saganbacteria bacterium]|nr:hypothetical protein [Candidatus Saganbacteria bacterium]